MIDASRPQLHLPTPSRLLTATYPRQAVFLDRDGVINHDTHFVSRPTEVEIMPGVPAALRHLHTRYALIVVTNQSGLARGYFDEAELINIHAEICQQLAKQGCWVDAFYFCPHLPDATVPAYLQDCECRKPRPGMLTRAAAEWGLALPTSYMVGDKIRDIEAGQAAGVQPILIGKAALPFPCHFADSLLDALQYIA